MSDIKRVYNCVPSRPDDRDLLFVEKLHSAKPTVLPTTVDLRTQCSPVVDQGDLGSCTANAIASGLREYLLLQNKKPLVRLSRLFLYYSEREVEGTINEDSGAEIRDGMDCMIKLGTCKEELDPYDISTFETHPSEAAHLDAANYKMNRYMRVVGLGGVKASLAQGFPVVTGMYVYDQMESQQAATTGIVSIPPRGAQPLGGHAVLTVGYVDTPNKYSPGYWKGGGYLILRNSWGDNWGLGGYFKIAYDYVNLGHAFEFWSGRV